MSDDFSWTVRVYYEDTDSGGVVYYANYLKFMERARSEWLRHLGFEQSVLMREERVLFPVSRLTIEYLKPARFEDVLSVGVRLLRRGRASLNLGQRIHRSSETSELLCRGEVRVACVDADTLQPRAIPTAIIHRLRSKT